jgi:hypothetical protein
MEKKEWDEWENVHTNLNQHLSPQIRDLQNNNADNKHSFSDNKSWEMSEEKTTFILALKSNNNECL